MPVVKEFYYLTIILSNCMFNGSAFLNDVNLFALETTIRNSLLNILNFEFRGVGCSMVRGNTNSLTLGISAGFYDKKQNLNDSSTEYLRIKIQNALTSIQGLVFSEISIETVMTGRKYV